MHSEFNGGLLIQENGNPLYSLKQSPLQPKGKIKFTLLVNDNIEKNKNKKEIRGILPNSLKFMFVFLIIGLCLFSFKININC